MTIPAMVEGEAISIGFNSVYLIDGLAGARSEEIDMEFSASSRPGVICDTTANYRYLVMPINI